MPKNWYVLSREKWVVCGGRDFSERSVVNSSLDHIVHMRGVPCLVITGGCPTGADKIAGEWALAMGVPLINVPADWERHGKGAGPIRNRQILAIHNPDLLICFPGGRGTDDMREAAEKYQAIEILLIAQRDGRE